MRVKKIILDKEKHHVKQNTLILCIQNLSCLKCCTNIWNSAYPRMHRTVHFQTSPLLDFPSSVKFTTIFQSPEAKTSECHLIFFSDTKSYKFHLYISLSSMPHIPIVTILLQARLKKPKLTSSQLSFTLALLNPIWCY